MESLFLSHIATLPFFVIYSVIFLGMVFEGETILFGAFFLAYEGYIDPYDTVFFVLMGTLIGNLLWYELGGRIHTLPFMKKANRHLGALDNRLAHFPVSTLVLTKFTYGLHHITLLRAKPAGVKLRKFLKIDVTASLIWISAVAVVAIVFSASLDLLKTYVKFAEVGLLIAIAIFVIAMHFTSSSLKKELHIDND